MKAHPDRIKKGLYWDRAWSLVEGCTPVSDGCRHCWSAAQTQRRMHQKNEKMQDRYKGLTNNAGRFNSRLRFVRTDLKKPLGVKKPQIWSIWNDLFHEYVTSNEIYNVFSVIQQCPQHRFIILTKRPNIMFYNIVSLFGDIATGETVSPWPFKNIWLGVTVESYLHMNRIDALLKIPAAVRFISMEPLLSPIKFDNRFREIDWIVCGGESGDIDVNPTHPDWVRSIRNQAQSYRIKFFFKQWGAWKPLYPQYGDRDPFVRFDDFEELEDAMTLFNNECCFENTGNMPMYSDLKREIQRCDYQPNPGSNPWWFGFVSNKKVARELDGRIHDEFPED